MGKASQVSLRATVFVGDTCRIVLDPAGMVEAGEMLPVAASLADPPTDVGVEEFVLL